MYIKSKIPNITISTVSRFPTLKNNNPGPGYYTSDRFNFDDYNPPVRKSIRRPRTSRLEAPRKEKIEEKKEEKREEKKVKKTERAEKAEKHEKPEKKQKGDKVTKKNVPNYLKPTKIKTLRQNMKGTTKKKAEKN